MQKGVFDTGEMETIQPKKRFDLEDRTAAFAKAVRDFAKQIPLTPLNTEDVKQVVRSSGSVAANYIEANDCLGKGDFAMRIRICRKESKESRFWFRMLTVPLPLEEIRKKLEREAEELMCIFGAILKKCT